MNVGVERSLRLGFGGRGGLEVGIEEGDEISEAESSFSA